MIVYLLVIYLLMLVFFCRMGLIRLLSKIYIENIPQ